MFKRNSSSPGLCLAGRDGRSMSATKELTAGSVVLCGGLAPEPWEFNDRNMIRNDSNNSTFLWNTKVENIQHCKVWLQLNMAKMVNTHTLTRN